MENMMFEDDFASEAGARQPVGAGYPQSPAPTPGVPGGGGGAGRCIMDSCEALKKRNNRFCSHHARFYDNLRYRKAKEGKQALTEWVGLMKDNDYAIRQIHAFAQQSIAAAAFRNKDLIQSV